MWGFFTILILYVITASFLMYRAANEAPPEGADYLIVLGAKVNGSDMSLSLYNRVKTALQYLKENPKTKVVVTGGKGPGEDITEAEAAETYFLNNGIASSRILKEDKSTSTFENFLYTKKLISSEATIVIVSNDFHLFRAEMIAKRLGYTNAYTLAADTPDIVKLQTYTREYAAILKSLIADRP
jgi:uncharacterized SAM-binding protein YcdF (DUF218 family)